MKNIKKLVDPGIIPFLSNKQDYESREDIIIICENKKNCNWSFNKTGISTFEYNYLEANDINEFDKADENVLKFYSDFLFQIIDDYRTLQIAERVRHTLGWRNNFDNLIRIEKLVLNSICFLKNNNIGSVFFQATPHNLPTWVLAKVAELLSIDVFMCQRSALPWRFYLVKGIDQQSIVTQLKNKEQEIEVEKEVLKDYIKINSEKYSSAIPSYERDRLKKRKGKYWSWNRELKLGLKEARVLVTLPFKKHLFNTYNKLASSPKLNGNYIVMFLHYQPERTSLPEGGYYSQQWLIIKMISLVLPKGWELIVKEHPSTFTGKYDVRYRAPRFYKDICSLSNVTLASLETDTFDLIDNAKFITTITGTVGIQSLIRGTAVLTFGCASYRDSLYTFEIENTDDLKKVISTYSNYNKNDISRYTITYLRSVFHNSQSGILNIDTDDVYGHKVRLVGNEKILIDFLNGFD